MSVRISHGLGMQASPGSVHSSESRLGKRFAVEHQGREHKHVDLAMPDGCRAVSGPAHMGQVSSAVCPVR